MLKKTSLIALMASTMVTAAIWSSQSSIAETLQESIQQALTAHPSVEAAQTALDIAEQDRKEARSELFPEISTNVSAGRIYADTSTSRGLTSTRGAAYSWMGEGSASVTQPIFNGRGTFSRMNAAKARGQSAELSVVDVRENLALRATQAHLAIMQAQATLNKTQSYYDVIQNYLERIQLMVDEGVADESEIAQAQNISLMLESALVDYKGQLQAAYAGYQEIVGHRPRSELMKPSFASSYILDDVEEAIQYAKVNHPLVMAGDKELIAADYDVKAQKVGYYPDFDAEASYLQKDQAEEIGGEVVDARAVLRMTWDFETGGGQQARTKRSKAQYSEILAQNRETMRTIEGDVRRTYAEYETANKQLELVKKREDVTQGLLSAYEAQFEGARVRLLQLMQAENQLFNAQLESINAEYRALLSQYSVLASMGKLLETVGTTDVADSIDMTLEASEPVTEDAPQEQDIIEPMAANESERTLVETSK